MDLHTYWCDRSYVGLNMLKSMLKEAPGQYKNHQWFVINKTRDLH